MPRKARIDAPGALHHVIFRGIERQAIFGDDKDRENFLERLSDLLQQTETPCYAWSLMTNHVHLLLRTGAVGISSIMRRLLTGYAVSFNRRYRRAGHLFQNRYKSILCEEDPYLRQLVAYIHLNPVRAGIVADIKTLGSYFFTGYSGLMGIKARPWQDTEYVLALFGKTVLEARRNLQSHLIRWSSKGNCPELIGGGLIRSAGGWQAVKEAYRDGIRLASDERILGSSEFVESTLKDAGEAYDRSMQLQAAGIDLGAVIGAVCRHLKVDERELSSPTRRVEIARARALISHIATWGLSLSGSQVAKRLNVDRSAISRAAQKVRNNAESMATAKSIMELLGPETSQQ